MKIIVPIKQVPGTTQVQIDPDTGTLIRSGVAAKLNPYDLYALETALRLKEELGATVTALTMGPPAAEAILREAYMMGADEGVLVSDRAFAGADVLATSYTLATAARSLGAFDLIICGRQTTDGDTAQVGPAMAEHLGIPHVAWVTHLEKADETGIEVLEDHSFGVQRSRMQYPCLITVEKTIAQPRLLSFRLKEATRERPIRVVGPKDLGGDGTKYGLDGSPTKVEKCYIPEISGERAVWEGEAGVLAQRFLDYLGEHRLWEVE